MKKLENELDKLHKKESNKNNKSIKEATLFLEAPKEDLSILRAINLDHQIHLNQKEVAVNNKLNHFKNTFNRKTFKGSELRELCLIYDLKLLYSQHYKGKLDDKLGSILKEFTKEFNIEVRSRDYFILAPREMFSETDLSNKSVMFFYRESGQNDRDVEANENDVFTLLHSWGKDLKPIRKARFLWYFSNCDVPSTMITFFATIFFIVSILMNLCKANLGLSMFFTSIAAFAIFLNSINNKNYDKSWYMLDKK